MDTEKAVLIAGGYGLVGGQVARMIRQRYPELPLLIGGRSMDRALRVAGELGLARAVVMDVDKPEPLAGLRPMAVLAVVNDGDNHLLRDAVERGIPYVDITRWSERVREAMAQVDVMLPAAPVMFASGWMGGVGAVLSRLAAGRFARVNGVWLDVLYALQDRSGPNSVEYMSRLASPFSVLERGERLQFFPYTDPHQAIFSGGRGIETYRFDTPDHLTIPRATGAETVAARIGFDDGGKTVGMLRFLGRTGLWRLISGPRFAALRQFLLYRPGKGAAHEFVVRVEGDDEGGAERSLRVEVHDPLGQSHLTALGAVLQLERVLGWDGGEVPGPGIVFPDSAPREEWVLKALRGGGVMVTGL